MKFYRLNLLNRFFSSKKSFAYLDVNKYNEIPSNYKGTKIENIIFECETCGYKRIDFFYPDLHYAVFNKDNVGDFSFGVNDYGQIAFSEKVLNLIEKYNIKGVVDVKKYKKLITKRGNDILSVDHYYDAKIKYLKLIIKKNNIDKEYLYNDEKIGCNECIGKKEWLTISPNAKLYISDLNKVNFDIFSIIHRPSEIFISEKFVEMCRKEGLTNILDKIVEVYSY